MPPVAAPQEQGRLADHDAHIRRTVLCQSVESAPWPTLLIDSTGAIVAVSLSAQHITGVTGGAPAYSILPDSADEQTRTRFEQALEFARADHPGDPCVFRRSESLRYRNRSDSGVDQRHGMALGQPVPGIAHRSAATVDRRAAPAPAPPAQRGITPRRMHPGERVASLGRDGDRRF